jgi:phosphoenolpyruvate carboxykinase (ATP)
VYGVGKAMTLLCTRKCVDSLLDASINKATFVKDPLFGFEIPTTVEGVPSEIRNPKDSWTIKVAFDATALNLFKFFKENFNQFILPCNDLSTTTTIPC